MIKPIHDVPTPFSHYIAISWWVEAKLTLRKENSFLNWMMGTLSTENR